MRSKQPTARLFVVMAIVAIGLYAPAYARGGYSAMSETESFRSASETKVMTHPISAPWTRARLKVAMRVSKGAAVLRLIDPSGSTRLEKTFQMGDASIDQTFPGNGIWRVELRFLNASGKYSIQLIGT
jgi:hypothetical protein